MVMPKNEHLGTRAQVRAEKDKEGRIARAIFLTIILLAAAFSGYFGYTILNSSPGLSFSGPTLQFKPENPNPELKAAIIDELSLTSPNQTFVQAATDILEQANYSVDYYSGEKVSVDLFRNLPTLGYGVIVLRVHSGTLRVEGTQQSFSHVDLSTSELYSSKEYVYEQLAGQLDKDSVTGLDQYYFGIAPNFVTSSMKGKFQNTTVIMMGCEGLTTTDMAKAFVERGAKAYISWSGSVSVSHTDQATITLLQHLILQKQSIKQAGENTTEELGYDPIYNSTLGYYPIESGNYTIPR
jgi:hypothetical protein